MNKDISLSDLRKDLIQQHMIGIELFKKLPAYDVHIHVTKKDEMYTAHTVQEWSEVRDFRLTQGYLLLGKKHYVLSVVTILLDNENAKLQ